MKTPIATRGRVGSIRQAGLTLIETLVALAIFALVVAGAIVLFGSASTSQTSTQMLSDLNGIRSATKAIYFGQGGYGAANAPLTEVLINGKRIPSSMAIGGTAPNRTVTHSMNGTVAVAAHATVPSQFTITVTNVPTAVCLSIATGQGWDSVKIGVAAERPTPVSPATASTDCAVAANQTMIFTSS